MEINSVLAYLINYIMIWKGTYIDIKFKSLHLSFGILIYESHQFLSPVILHIRPLSLSSFSSLILELRLGALHDSLVQSLL